MLELIYAFVENHIGLAAVVMGLVWFGFACWNWKWFRKEQESVSILSAFCCVVLSATSFAVAIVRA